MALATAATPCVGWLSLGGAVETKRSDEPHFLYFIGGDQWPHWAFAHVGAIWSPGGLNNEGFALKLLANGGTFHYQSGALNDADILGINYSVAALPGWRFKRDGFEVTVFAGYELQNFRLIPNDPDTRLRGVVTGFRGGFELWHEPSPTTMLAADASASSTGAGHYARLAYGWRLLDRFYLGPESQIYVTDRYTHTRAGVHITALKFDDREISGAVGYATDNDHRSGLYLRIGLLTRR